MFQTKIDEVFKEPPNVFGIVDDIVGMGYDSNGIDYENTLQSVLQICRKRT